MSDGPEKLIPYDLTAEPKVRFLLPPGWEERFKELTPRAEPDHPALPLAVEEAAHIAEVRARVRAFEGHLNAVIAGVLPEGTRFEWPPVSEDQAPDRIAALGDSVALGFGDGIASAVRAAFGETGGEGA